MVTKTRNIKDDAQQLHFGRLRFFAPYLFPGLGVLSAGLAAWLLWGGVAALVVSSLGIAILSTMIALQTVRKTAAISAARDRQVKVAGALANASRALLERRVMDPVGTAVSGLLDAVDADTVFLETNSKETPDENGNTATVRDILHRAGEEGREGYWELTGWRVGPHGKSVLSAGGEFRTAIAQLDSLTAAFYKAAMIRSEILVPITIEGKWIGSIGFQSRQANRAWDDEDIRVLRAAAGMIGAFWERRDNKARLEEMLAAKDEFIASVSHEVRTPLTSVLGFAAELDENGDKFSREERAELIGLIASQSREVANIVDDLLTAARAEAGTIVIAPQIQSARKLVGDVLASHSGRVDFTMTDDVDIWADDGRVRQVLRNLLTNADRYGGDVVKINVGRAPGGMMRLEVRDNGEGIPYHMRDQVFEPYARAKNSSTQPASVGLGLSVARRLAHLMDGDLVLSEEDGWTVFTLLLPMAEAAGDRVPVS